MKPLVLIEWEDAYNGDHSWFGLDELPESVVPMIVQTVGFELRAGKDRTTLAMSLNSHEGSAPENACDLFHIPASMIRKRTVLRKGDE